MKNSRVQWKVHFQVKDYFKSAWNASTTDQSEQQYSPNALNPHSVYRKRVTGELKESNSLH